MGPAFTREIYISSAMFANCLNLHNAAFFATSFVMHDFVLQPDLEVKNCSCWKSMVLPPSPPVLPGSLFYIFGRESLRMRLRLQGHVFVYRHVVSRAQNSEKNEHTRKITCTTNKIPSDNCLNTRHWMHVGVTAQYSLCSMQFFIMHA